MTKLRYGALNKSEKYDTIKVGNFKDNLRWNYYTTYDKSNLQPKEPIIIKHYSSIAEKVKPYGSNVEIKNKDILDTLDKYLDFYYNRDKYISSWFKTTRS